MIYRTRRHEFDGDALIFVGMILISITSIICITVAGMRSAEYKHIEKMEQIKTCEVREQQNG